MEEATSGRSPSLFPNKLRRLVIAYGGVLATENATMGGEIGEVSLPACARLLPAATGLPLGPLLTLSLRSLARRRPAVFERLGDFRNAHYLIDPTDLPFAFVVVPDGQSALVQVVRSGASPQSDVIVRGPILMLLGLLDGTFDGDALFFHRTLSVSGRTEALVALRNAIEDAELRPSDLLDLRGQPGRFADRCILGGLDLARRLIASAAHHPRRA
jgi:predicted lipid carrier protein YhbT